MAPDDQNNRNSLKGDIELFMDRMRTSGNQVPKQLVNNVLFDVETANLSKDHPLASMLADSDPQATINYDQLMDLVQQCPDEAWDGENASWVLDTMRGADPSRQKGPEQSETPTPNADSAAADPGVDGKEGDLGAKGQPNGGPNPQAAPRANTQGGQRPPPGAGDGSGQKKGKAQDQQHTPRGEANMTLDLGIGTAVRGAVNAVTWVARKTSEGVEVMGARRRQKKQKVGGAFNDMAAVRHDRKNVKSTVQDLREIKQNLADSWQLPKEHARAKQRDLALEAQAKTAELKAGLKKLDASQANIDSESLSKNDKLKMKAEMDSIKAKSDEALRELGEEIDKAGGNAADKDKRLFDSVKEQIQAMIDMIMKLVAKLLEMLFGGKRKPSRGNDGADPRDVAGKDGVPMGGGKKPDAGPVGDQVNGASAKVRKTYDGDGDGGGDGPSGPHYDGGDGLGGP